MLLAFAVNRSNRARAALGVVTTTVVIFFSLSGLLEPCIRLIPERGRQMPRGMYSDGISFST